MKFMKNSSPSHVPSLSVRSAISACSARNATQKPSWPTMNVPQTRRNSGWARARNGRSFAATSSDPTGRGSRPSTWAARRGTRRAVRPAARSRPAAARCRGTSGQEVGHRVVVGHVAAGEAQRRRTHLDDAHQHDGEAEAGEHLVPLEVASAARRCPPPRARWCRRVRRGLPGGARRSCGRCRGRATTPRSIWCPPSESISQSRQPVDPPSWNRMLPMRASPHDSAVGVSAGWLASIHASAAAAMR